MTKTVSLECKECGVIFERRLAEHKRSIRLDRKEFCTQSCQARYWMRRRSVSQDSLDNLIPGREGDMYTPFRYFAQVRHARAEKTYDLDLKYLRGLWQEQGGICPITGWKLDLPISTAGYKDIRSPYNASLDRIDSNQGYIKGNVRYIALIANYAKHQWDDEVVLEFARAVLDHAERNCGSEIGIDWE